MVILAKRSSGKRIVIDDTCYPNFIQSFAPLCRAIRTSSLYIDNKANITEQLLATLLSKLRSYYETKCGRNGTFRCITIPSISVFLDFKVRGSVHIILATLLEGATVRDLLPIHQVFEFDENKLLSILFEIEKNLTLGEVITRPSIFLNKVPVNLINRLAKIALEHGGKLVNTADKATHIVDYVDEFDSQSSIYQVSVPSGGVMEEVRLVHFRSIDAPQDQVRVHWLFTPDSYDEYFHPSSLTTNKLEAEDLQSMLPSLMGSRKVQWTVCCRYILDCEIFREWGNEQDYEVQAVTGSSSGLVNGNISNVMEEESEVNEDTGLTSATGVNNTAAANGSNRRGKGRKRNSASALTSGNGNGGTAIKKEKDKSVSAATTLTEKLFPDLLPLGLSSSSSSSTVVTMDITNETPVLSVSSSSLQEVPTSSIMAAVAESKDPNDLTDNPDPDRQNIQGQASAGSLGPLTKRKRASELVGEPSHLSEQQQALDVLSQPLTPPDWFSLDTISWIEKRYLFSLLYSNSTSHSSAEYKALRNAIIQMYSLNPSQYLTATECRRKISGDAARVLKIHEFLDTFGVINYQVKLEGRPSSQRSTAATHSLSTEKKALLMQKLKRWPTLDLRSTVLIQEQQTDRVWTAEMDERLLSLIKKHRQDWNSITEGMNEILLKGNTSSNIVIKEEAGNESKEEKNEGMEVIVTAEEVDQKKPNPQQQQVLSIAECMTRFLEMQLPLPSLTTNVVPASSARGNTEDPTLSASTENDKPVTTTSTNASSGSDVTETAEGVATVAQDSGANFKSSEETRGVDLSRSAIHRRIQLAVQLIQQLENLFTDIAKQNRALQEVFSKESLETWKIELSQMITVTNDLLQRRADDYSVDVLQSKVQTMESKLAVFRHVEAVLELEREQLQREQREFFLQQIQTGNVPPPLLLPASSASANASSLLPIFSGPAVNTTAGVAGMNYGSGIASGPPYTTSGSGVASSTGAYLGQSYAALTSNRYNDL